METVEQFCTTFQDFCYDLTKFETPYDTTIHCLLKTQGDILIDLCYFDRAI